MKSHSLWPAPRSRRKIELETDVSECGTFQMVSVRGRLTIDTAPALLVELRRQVRRADRIKVDLSQVEFLDSSGISVLIQGLKLAQERSADYVLLDPSPKVRAVIELSQLQTFFAIESSADEPCEASSSEAPTAAK